MDDEQHKVLLAEAVAREAEAHRALLAGDHVRARDELRAASDRYRASWDAAPPDAFGRLVGMVKAAVLAGEATTAARFVRSAVGDEPSSPTSGYALAIAALVEGDDAVAARAAEAMRAGSEPFQRAADAIAALAAGDGSAYARAVEAIVADFAARESHLTGVPIADTALMLERLAGARGLAAGTTSPLLPAS
ncbi:MAG TPA: hypothetical protein VGW10_07895 [Solirubrobacteraceae bacterium]|nr:hypothetical protein [Solirubrobacteraceae bacterium]